MLTTQMKTYKWLLRKRDVDFGLCLNVMCYNLQFHQLQMQVAVQSVCVVTVVSPVNTLTYSVVAVP